MTVVTLGPPIPPAAPAATTPVAVAAIAASSLAASVASTSTTPSPEIVGRPAQSAASNGGAGGPSETAFSSTGERPIAQSRPLFGEGKEPLPFWEKFNNKGDVSNWLSFLMMVAGIILEMFVLNEHVRPYNVVLAFGLYGFAGGITNGMAVKMLFDKVPGLYGSGVIPNEFEAIRAAIKTAIMDTFFDEAFLHSYLRERGPKFLKKFVFDAYVSRPDFDDMFAEKLEEVSQTPSGAMLNIVKPFFGGSYKKVVPVLKPLLVSVATSISDSATVGSEMASLDSIADFRQEVESMMDAKLRELSPNDVKRLLADIVREHLGWLVVWGNVFGGMIGLVTLAVRLAALPDE